MSTGTWNVTEIARVDGKYKQKLVMGDDDSTKAEVLQPLLEQCICSRGNREVSHVRQ